MILGTPITSCYEKRSLKMLVYKTFLVNDSPLLPPHCTCLLLESLHSKIVRGYTQFLQGFSAATLLAMGILFASVSILLTRSISPMNYWLFCLIAQCIYSSKHFYNPQLNADSYPCKHNCPQGFSLHFGHVKEKHAFLPSA